MGPTLNAYNPQYLLIFDPALADNDVFNCSTATKLLLMNRVMFVNLLTLVFWQMIQSILVNHSGSVMLNGKLYINKSYHGGITSLQI